jgi:hypothetical protein
MAGLDCDERPASRDESIRRPVVASRLTSAAARVRGESVYGAHRIPWTATIAISAWINDYAAIS